MKAKQVIRSNYSFQIDLEWVIFGSDPYTVIKYHRNVIEAIHNGFKKLDDIQGETVISVQLPVGPYEMSATIFPDKAIVPVNGGTTFNRDLIEIVVDEFTLID